MKPIKIERETQRGNWDRGFAVEILHPGLTLSGGTAESAPSAGSIAHGSGRVTSFD